MEEIKEEKIPIGLQGFIMNASLVQISTIKSKVLDQVENISTSGQMKTLKEHGYKLIGVASYQVLMQDCKNGKLKRMHWTDFPAFAEVGREYLDDLPQVFVV